MFKFYIIIFFACVLALDFEECMAEMTYREFYDQEVYKFGGSDAIPTTMDKSLNVSVSLALISIREVDKDRNEIEIVAWLGTQYKNPYSVWNAALFGIESIPVPTFYTWLPDLTPYNGVKAPEFTMSPEPKVVLSSDGNVVYYQPLRLRFLCDLQGVDTPDGASCSLKMGSWVYNGFQLDFTEPITFDMSNYVSNPHYTIEETSAVKNVEVYECCPEPYPSLNFNINLRKKGAEKKSGIGSWF